MLPTCAVCFWATTVLAACSMRTRVPNAAGIEDDRGRFRGQHYPAMRFQSRASSMIGQTSATGFPYRFVFPANHPALNGPAVYSHYLQNPHQSEQLLAEEVYTVPSSKHVPLTEHSHLVQHNQPQQQQLGFESVGKFQYDFLGGGGGGSKHHVPQHQPYHMLKQPKHYQSYQLAPSPSTTVQQSPFVSPAGSGSIAQPIMLLIPSGQPGAPYQTLVLIPSSSIPPTFPGISSPFPGPFSPGPFPVARGPPMQIASYPSGNGPGLGKYSGTQLFHRSHDPVQSYPHHLQQMQKTLQKSSSSSSSYHQGSGSEHVPQTTGGGAEPQQPLEDKVSHGSTASGENSNERVDDRAGTETKSEEKNPSAEYGDKTTSTTTLKRIVVT